MSDNLTLAASKVIDDNTTSLSMALVNEARFTADSSLDFNTSIGSASSMPPLRLSVARQSGTVTQLASGNLVQEASMSLDKHGFATDNSKKTMPSDAFGDNAIDSILTSTDAPARVDTVKASRLSEQKFAPVTTVPVALTLGNDFHAPPITFADLEGMVFPEYAEFPTATGQDFNAKALVGDKYLHIDALLKEVTDDNIKKYVREFTVAVEKEVLMIGSIPIKDIVMEENRLRQEGLDKLKEEHDSLHAYNKRLNLVMEAARERLTILMKQKMRELHGESQRLRQEEIIRNDEMSKAFSAAETHLLDILEKRKGEVHSLYGDLVLADGVYAGNRARRWRVDWDRTPQPIQIKMVMLRGVRDKLPSGRYSLVVSLQDRLGGRLLRWSKLRGQEWGGATLPINHSGRFADTDIKVGQSVFTACPALPDIRPSMCMIFELYLIMGPNNPVDRVVGWGCFPVADSEFNVLTGTFKVPILSGQVNHQIEKFGSIEKRMSETLNNWLCNLYFEIVKLPRYVSGQREYEVGLQFSSGLLGFPLRQFKDAAAEESIESAMPTSDRPQTSFGGALLRKRIGTTAPGERKTRSQTDVQADIADYAIDTLEPVLDRNIPVKKGVVYDLHVSSVFDQYQREVIKIIPQTRLGIPRECTEQEAMDQHTFSVVPRIALVPLKNALVKVNYMRRQLLAELGLNQFKSGEYWFSVLCFLSMFWVRLYAHYFGQWLFLQGLSLPISSFTFMAITVDLKYQASALLAQEEIGVTVIGPLMLVGVMVLMCIISWISQRVLGSFTALASRVVCAWGILTILDPILILIVDLCYGRHVYHGDAKPIGDAFKLYWHFLSTDGSGVPGAFLTAFLYIVIMTTSSIIFYMYFLRLHMNGRMMDTYQRLTAMEDDFFFPFDNEVSNDELGKIIKKQEQWRGPKGERRKVAIFEYIWTEETGTREITTHVSIHTLHLDGSREMFRQFLRLPDGAITEVFGSMQSGKMESRVQQTMLQASVNVDTLVSNATNQINSQLQTTGDLQSGVAIVHNGLSEKRSSSMDFSMRKNSRMSLSNINFSDKDRRRLSSIPAEKDDDSTVPKNRRSSRISRSSRDSIRSFISPILPSQTSVVASNVSLESVVDMTAATTVPERKRVGFA